MSVYPSKNIYFFFSLPPSIGPWSLVSSFLEFPRSFLEVKVKVISLVHTRKPLASTPDHHSHIAILQVAMILYYYSCTVYSMIPPQALDQEDGPSASLGVVPMLLSGAAAHLHKLLSPTAVVEYQIFMDYFFR